MSRICCAVYACFLALLSYSAALLIRATICAEGHEVSPSGTQSKKRRRACAQHPASVKHIYFIAETKGDMSSMQLRDIEKGKIHCAREHFKAISRDDVVYDVVDSYQSLLNIVTK